MNEIDIEIQATEREIETLQRQLSRLKAIQVRSRLADAIGADSIQRMADSAKSDSASVTPVILPFAEKVAPEPAPAPKAETPQKPCLRGKPSKSGQPGESILTVLRYVRDNGPSTYTQICDATGKAGSTMQKAYDWLEKDADGKRWKLNAKGLQAVLAESPQQDPSSHPSHE